MSKAMFKKPILIPFILIILSVFLTSCDEEIPIDKIDPYTEKLVVNEYFNNLEPFTIEISTSKNAYKTPIPTILDSSQVKVVLLENGIPMPLLYNAFDKIFYTSTNPASNKKYELSVSSNGYNTVHTLGTLPDNISSKTALYIEDGGIDMEGNTSDLLKLTFKDDENTKDYYKLNFFYYSELAKVFTAFDFDENDILSAVSTIKARDGGYLFSDESFNGKMKTFTAIPPSGIVAGNTDIKYLIQIQRLSDDFWKYNTTLEQYRGGTTGGSGSNIFGGAVVVYSNIKNGLGIFAGSNIESDTLR
jgi:hypothetical protein